MPNFNYPIEIPGDGKLNEEQVMFYVSQCMADEMEAAYRYMMIAERIDDEALKGLLIEVSGDEYVHHGNFYRYLIKNFPDLYKKFKQGFKETDEIMSKYKEVVDKMNRMKKESGDDETDNENDSEIKDEIPSNIPDEDIEEELEKHKTDSVKIIKVVRMKK